MKSFNLDEFKAGKLAIRRDGTVARFEAYVEDAAYNHKVVYSAVQNGVRYVFATSPTGKTYNDGYLCSADLIGMAATKWTVWLNIRTDGRARWYNSAEIAKKEVRDIATYVAIAVQVEIEE